MKGFTRGSGKGRKFIPTTKRNGLTKDQIRSKRNLLTTGITHERLHYDEEKMKDWTIREKEAEWHKVSSHNQNLGIPIIVNPHPEFQTFSWDDDFGDPPKEFTNPLAVQEISFNTIQSKVAFGVLEKEFEDPDSKINKVELGHILEMLNFLPFEWIENT